MEGGYYGHDATPPPVPVPGASVPSHLDEYLFDLRGYVLIRGALSREEVDAGNDVVDSIPRTLARNEWHGHVHREDHPPHRGTSYQQIYEAGSPFERLIDHPSYINFVFRFMGGQQTFDTNHGPGFIDENFFNLRMEGEAIPLHAGGHDRAKRMQFRYHNGRFQCGQVNVLIAFSDIGPGDGGTMIIPGSHKSNIIHPAMLEDPEFARWGESGGASAEGVEGAIEVPMEAGDALLFVDACSHGSASRVNPGERRICVYRYGSSWNRTRWGYQPSPALLGRLNPFARQLVDPNPLARRPPGAPVIPPADDQVLSAELNR